MRIVENLKSMILTALILSSLILTGSLWFDNYQGLSFAISKIPDLFVSKINQEEYSKVYGEIIMPYKVTVINPDQNKWIAYSSDKMNQDAWNILKNRLSNLSQDTEIITGKIKEWDDLINRKSIIFEFGGPLDEEVLALAIPNLPKDTGAFRNVEMFSITKSLAGNTIYIMQNDNGEKSLYKVLLKGEDDEIKTFMQSCENIKADVKYVALETLGISKFYNDKSVSSSKNVLFPITNQKDKRDIVKKINVKNHFSNDDEYAMGKFVTEIFDNTDFAKFITNDNGKIYINDDKSSIKLESNGIVEYINNSKVSEEETSSSKDFNVALDFINNMKVFEKFFLLSATKSEGIYTFDFYVALDGVVAGFREPTIGDNSNCIMEIKVQNGEIRYFNGKLIDIEETNETSYVFKITHNILDALLKDVGNGNKVNISELKLVYDVTNEGIYYPSWVTVYSLKQGEEDVTALTVTDR